MYHDVIPPPTHERFVAEFPQLAEAWSACATAGQQGPIEARTARLVKLAIAIATGSEGAVRANVRKARADGIGREELMQVLALCAGTVGFPALAAGYNWMVSTLDAPD